jgi:copper resistance protein C
MQQHSPRIRVISGAAVAALIAVAGTASPAAAHTTLQSSNPEADSTVSKPLTQVELDFTGSIRDQFTEVTVRGPGGRKYETGAPSTDGDKVAQPLLPLDASGKYRIAYRVVAEDGHPITGKISFTVTWPASPVVSPSASPGSGSAGRTATPTSRAASDPAAGGSGPGWPIVIGGVALLALLTGSIVFARKRRSDPR